MSVDAISLETTDLSIPHRLLCRRGFPGKSARSGVVIFVGAILVMYLPIVLLAAIDPAVPMIRTSPSMKLPLLRDWNVACMFLLSFPTLLILLVGDQAALHSAISRVSDEGVIRFKAGLVEQLSERWRTRFRVTNIVGQVAGVMAGAVVAYSNFVASTSSGFGSWVAPAGAMRPAGIFLLVALFVFYGIVPLYAARGLAIALLLRDVARASDLDLVPWHPDRCGGLRPIGRIGLRNQFVLSVLGLNVVLLSLVTVVYLGTPKPMVPLLVSAAAAYLVLGPLVFVGPLLPFRRAMSDTKRRLGIIVAQRMRTELKRVIDSLASGPVPADIKVTLEHLTGFGRALDDLPVWPFDTRTVRQFLAAYVLPVMSAIGIPLIDAGVGAFLRSLGLG